MKWVRDGVLTAPRTLDLELLIFILPMGISVYVSGKSVHFLGNVFENVTWCAHSAYFLPKFLGNATSDVKLKRKWENPSSPLLHFLGNLHYEHTSYEISYEILWEIDRFPIQSPRKTALLGFCCFVDVSATINDVQFWQKSIPIQLWFRTKSLEYTCDFSL